LALHFDRYVADTVATVVLDATRLAAWERHGFLVVADLVAPAARWLQRPPELPLRGF